MAPIRLPALLCSALPGAAAPPASTRFPGGAGIRAKLEVIPPQEKVPHLKSSYGRKEGTIRIAGGLGAPPSSICGERPGQR